MFNSELSEKGVYPFLKEKLENGLKNKKIF